jgi:hypothetical protein
MKQLLVWLIMAVMVCFLSGCGSKIDKAAQQAKVPGKSIQNTAPPSEAEALIEKAFRATTETVPWEEGRPEAIDKYRNGIDGITEYVITRLNFAGEIPYYLHKVWFEVTSYCYNKYQIELDARLMKPGAISPEGRALYDYAVRDVHNLLRAERIKISETEKSIEDRANQDTIEDMKRIYKTIEPLISLGKKVL